MQTTCACCTTLNIFIIIGLSITSIVYIHNSINYNISLPDNINELIYTEDNRNSGNDFLIRASDIWIPINVSYQFNHNNHSECFFIKSLYHCTMENLNYNLNLLYYVANAYWITKRTNADKVYVYYGRESGNKRTILNVDSSYNCYAKNIINGDKSATIYDLSVTNHGQKYCANHVFIDGCWKSNYKQFYIVNNVTYYIEEPIYTCCPHNIWTYKPVPKTIYYNKYNPEKYTDIIQETRIIPNANSKLYSDALNENINGVKNKLDIVYIIVIIVLSTASLTCICGCYTYYKNLMREFGKVNQENKEGIVLGPPIEEHFNELEGEVLVRAGDEDSNQIEGQA